MIIRPANFNDTAQITALGISLLDIHHSFDSEYYQMEDDRYIKFHQWCVDQIKNPSAFIIVAEEPMQKKVVGFISGFIKVLFPWFKIKSVGHISFLIIDPAYRKHHVGQLLEEEGVKWFISKNLVFSELYVDELNIVGTNAWNKYGYTAFKKFLRKKI